MSVKNKHSRASRDVMLASQICSLSFVCFRLITYWTLIGQSPSDLKLLAVAFLFSICLGVCVCVRVCVCVCVCAPSRCQNLCCASRFCTLFAQKQDSQHKLNQPRGSFPEVDWDLRSQGDNLEAAGLAPFPCSS